MSPGNEVEHTENDKRNAEKNRHDVNQTPDDESEHGRLEWIAAVPPATDDRRDRRPLVYSLSTIAMSCQCWGASTKPLRLGRMA